MGYWAIFEKKHMKNLLHMLKSAWNSYSGDCIVRAKSHLYKHTLFCDHDHIMSALRDYKNT